MEIKEISFENITRCEKKEIKMRLRMAKGNEVDDNIFCFFG